MANPAKGISIMNGRSAWLVAWLGIVTTLALPGTSLASETLAAKAYTGRATELTSPPSRPQARSAARYPFGTIVWLSANSRSEQGYLRVAIENSGAGFSSPAVLKAPDNRGLFPNLRRAQQWRAEHNSASDFPGSIRLRNIYSDKCLTAARPHGSPVYLQNCGNILGQAWDHKLNGMLWSLNYNQTFPAGCSCTTLDIPNGRNVVGTRLVVARHTGTWNQLWDVTRVPEALR
jgi:hypothetical protein